MSERASGHRASALDHRPLVGHGASCRWPGAIVDRPRVQRSAPVADHGFGRHGGGRGRPSNRPTPPTATLFAYIRRERIPLRLPTRCGCQRPRPRRSVPSPSDATAPALASSAALMPPSPGGHRHGPLAPGRVNTGVAQRRPGVNGVSCGNAQSTATGSVADRAAPDHHAHCRGHRHQLWDGDRNRGHRHARRSPWPIRPGTAPPPAPRPGRGPIPRSPCGRGCHRPSILPASPWPMATSTSGPGHRPPGRAQLSPGAAQQAFLVQISG